jgi:hypothetical protein
MKTIFQSCLLLCILTLAFLGCKETPLFNKDVSILPSISSFSPSQGPAGTLITIKGVGLQHINEAFIGNQAVTVKYRVSDEEIVVEATATGRSGPINLKDTKANATSADVFTYTYVKPQLSVTPDVLTVGDIAVIKGINLNAVSKVFVGSKQAGIVSTINNEVAFKIPFIADPTATISIRYFDGTSEQTIVIDKVATISVLLPQVQSLSTATPRVGQTITLSGNNLNYIDSVKIGNTKMAIKSKSSSAIELDLVDNTNEFVDGNNTLPLTFYSYLGEYIKKVGDVQYYVPSYYLWPGKEIYGRNKDHAYNSTFFCLQTGISYTPATYDLIDPWVNTKKKTATGNVIDKVLFNKTEYESSLPYFYLHDEASNLSIWSSAQKNTLIKNYYKNVTINPTTGAGTGGSSITGDQGLSGTPVLTFRILDPNIPAEAAVINQVKTQSFSELNFTNLLMNAGISFSGSTNGLSNVPTYYAPVIKASNATASLRSFSGLSPFPAGGIYNINENIDIDAVIAVFYLKYNYTSNTTVDFTNVEKSGFLHVKKYIHIPKSGGAKANLIFDAYWQRTPNP